MYMSPSNQVEVFGPDPSKAFGGLTQKQYRYCEARAAGMTKIDAYRHAYQTDALDHTIHGMAAEVESNPAIPETINRMALARKPETTLVPKVNKNFVLEGITNIAIKETAKDNVRLRAYELLGKAVGLFKDEAPAPDKPRTIEEIDAELRARLSAMRTIEGTATRQPAEAKPEPSAYTDRRRKPKT